MDADASLDPQQLNRVVAPLVDGTADLVIGRRTPVNSAAFAWPLRLANRELSRQVFRRTGLRLTDLGPMRAARREALLALHIKDRRSVEVDYLPRRGRSKVTGSPMGAWRAARDMSAALRTPIDPIPRVR